MEQDYLDFLTYLKEVKGASSNTVQAYRNDLHKLLVFLEKQQITITSKITETVLNSYILSLENEGFSPASVTRNIAAMKAFLLYLMKNGRINGDPSERIKPPKVKKKAPKVLELNLMEELLLQPDLATQKGIRDKAMLELLYATGMKVSELLALRVEDVNVLHGFVTCGERRERSIPIGKSSIDAMNAYLAIRKQNSGMENDILFLNHQGKQISRQGFWKLLKFYSKAAGLEDIMPNTFRHSFAAHLLQNGADLESVQEFLGHSDISTTQVYLMPRYKNSREVYQNTHPRA
ncbi:MAG: xerD [Herbinix sp.]|jgi:integrase/recombinase XerD|nr:xerD [Herbinix sp.]